VEARYSWCRVIAGVLGLLVAGYVFIDAALAPAGKNSAAQAVSAVQLTQVYTGDLVTLGAAALAVLCVWAMTTTHLLERRPTNTANPSQHEPEALS
jgi:hypothetical protein